MTWLVVFDCWINWLFDMSSWVASFDSLWTHSFTELIVVLVLVAALTAQLGLPVLLVPLGVGLVLVTTWSLFELTLEVAGMYKDSTRALCWTCPGIDSWVASVSNCY